MKLKNLIIAIAALAGLNSCEDKTEVLYFTGDSIVARWDLSEYFPAYVCHNEGVSGSGIEYLESQAGKYAGKNGVVISGTNDLGLMSSMTLEAYATRYLSALENMHAERLYLYPVLPRDCEGEGPGVIKAISEFNDKVKQLTADEPTIIYLDVFGLFMLDGKPNPQYFSDHLHLTPYGYEVLAKKLTEHIK